MKLFDVYPINNINIVKELLKQKNIMDYDRYPEYGNSEFMYKLIESYNNNPILTRQELILDENIETYCMIILISDGYLKLKNGNKKRHIMARLSLLYCNSCNMCFYNQ